MSEHQLLPQYKKDVNNIIQSAKELNLEDKQIEAIFLKCFQLLKNGAAENVALKSECTRRKCRTFLISLIKLSLLVLILAIFIYIVLNVHQPTASLVLRNVQGLIYPGLKILRFLSVPIIKRYPSLTNLYDESCLLDNPYFYVHEMECWPCHNVYSVTELTEVNNQSIYLSGNPYITRTSHQTVPYAILKDFYKENKALLDSESNSIKSNSYKIAELNDLFSQNQDELSLSNVHVSWRINRMVPARIIRNVFPKVDFLPERAGQSVERFVMIDGAKASHYNLPNTECSFISVRQALGKRTIVLKPSPECNHECRPVSIILHSSDTLWYNWWYWRPISLPTENATEMSISYISSYC